MLERKFISLPCLYARAYTLDSNYHGPKMSTLRNTCKVVRMGSYAKSWTIYIYRNDGRAHALNFTFPRWRGPWPAQCSEKEPIRRTGGEDA